VNKRITVPQMMQLSEFESQMDQVLVSKARSVSAVNLSDIIGHLTEDLVFGETLRSTLQSFNTHMHIMSLLSTRQHKHLTHSCAILHWLFEHACLCHCGGLLTVSWRVFQARRSVQEFSTAARLRADACFF